MSAEQEKASRQAAEQAREQTWKGSSFLREAFLGRYRPELLPAMEPRALSDERPEFQTFYNGLEHFLKHDVDPVEIDTTGEYPPRVIEGLKQLGAFGMKISTEFGGLGLSHREYVRAMELLGSYDANITALLSAHQAIGVPHPVATFGSDYLKHTYLPRCARGAISAFALTEPAVGSDPARLATTVKKSEDGKHYVLDGRKLWCTNGTFAEVIVVLARDADTHKIHCLVVETDWEGVLVERRCHFMGLRALGNALMRFDNVQVPVENLVGEEGQGLRIALATLNTGRLTLPAATAGAAKKALEICRKWSLAREQWGRPVGKHEAVAHKLSDMASTAYTMEAVAHTVGALADLPDRDIRLEAAAAKEWNTERGWALTDSALQIRGGRGYETEKSLQARGEPPIGIERMLRDSRINRIFEGSSEIMHLFIAREAVDKHLEVAGVLIDPEIPVAKKLATLPLIAFFYAVWYPKQWLGALVEWTRYREYGPLTSHFRFAAAASRKLARSVFHGMLRFGPKLELKQAFLFRAVDVALELFALTSGLLRAHARKDSEPFGLELATRFARDAEARIDDLLRDMWNNDDAQKSALAERLLSGHYGWLEQGTMGMPYSVDDMRPQNMDDFLAERKPLPAPTELLHSAMRPAASPVETRHHSGILPPVGPEVEAEMSRMAPLPTAPKRTAR